MLGDIVGENGRSGQVGVDRIVINGVEIECPLSANDFSKKEISKLLSLKVKAYLYLVAPHYTLLVGSQH